MPPYEDFTIFGACLAGPNVTDLPAGCDPADFEHTDLDMDADVALEDLAAFQVSFGE